ncbi:MAG TPA: PAS domain-containing protein, partial [Candidatus Polarisedimenticolia bacterium]|nr:PAS domain-containing protein [Candidatus Polarisedimenticolia bacterium]
MIDARLLSGILDVVDECVLVCDDKNRILFANRALERVLGYAAGELIGQDIAVLRPVEDRAKPLESLQAMAGDGERGTVRRRRRDGQI